MSENRNARRRLQNVKKEAKRWLNALRVGLPKARERGFDGWTALGGSLSQSAGCLTRRATRETA